MEDSSLEAKQRYMRERILDAGHDAEQFVEFCSDRHDLEDLENWTMDQLRQIVHDFIQSLQPPIQVHQLPNLEQDKQEFGNFQEPFVHPPSIAIPAASNKMGLVFTDDDWNMLLSGPSIVDKGKNGDNQNKNIQIPLFTLSLDNLPLQPLNSPKNIPLSPPSICNPSISSQPNIFIPSQQKQQNPKIEDKTQPQHQQKQQKKIGQGNNNPINLSNVKISTAKQKALNPLPAITDVIVTKTEQIARNFLQSDYTLYHIQFNPSQHIIQRKFTDLRRVRAVLQRLYPFLRLPYLEPEGWINSSEGKDLENLSKYKLMVEQFIKYLIIKSDELKNCELVRTLCGFSSKGEKGQVSKEQLKKKLQAYEYIPRPKFIGEVILSNNSILIPPVSSGQKLINQTVNLLTEIDLYYERLRKQLDVLFINYEELIKSIGEVALTFDSLENLIKKYNADNTELPQVRIFEGLKEMTLKLSNRIDAQYGIFKSRIKGLFRYQKQNMATLKEVIECRNKINYEYVRRGLPAFTSNKLKLQGETVEIQSPIALEEPVRNNKNALAIQEIFWSFMCSREIKRYWEHLRRKIGEHLTLIAYDELDSENENLNFWNLIIKKCVI